MQDIYSYYAFISYKHEDEEYAKWLQKRLESYRLPAALQNEGVPERANPIFRDNTDLTPGQPLKESIKDKLKSSKYLIVLCSRNLAKGSEYVDYEIKSFVEMGRADRIIPVIIDGEPHAENPDDECFCRAIKELPGEILAADSKKDGRNIASLKIIAALFQLDADDLIKRDEKRRRKNRLICGAAATFLFVLATVAIITIFNFSFKVNSEKAMKAYSEKDYTVAANYAVKALRVPGKKDEKAELEAVIRGSVISEELKNTNSQFRKEYEIKLPNEGIALYGESKDGSKVAFTDLGKVWVCDAESGEELAVYDRASEKEALDSYLDPIRYTEETLGDEYEEKTESEKYTQQIIGGNKLNFYDESGKTVCSLDVGKRVMWAYSKDDSFVVISTADEKDKAYVYSFDYDLLIELGRYDENLANRIWISDMGRYVFIEMYKAVNVYDTASGSRVATLTDDSTVKIGASFIVSESDREAVYFFFDAKAEKYVFEDAKPEFDKYIITEDNTAVSVKATAKNTVCLSADGKKMLVDHMEVFDIFDIESGELLMGVHDATIALNVNFDLCILSVDNRVMIFNVDEQETLYETEAYTPVVSVAMNEDGSYAAYTTESGIVYILKRNGNTYSVKKYLSAFEGRTLVNAMKGDTCVIYDETQSYMYSIEADTTEKFSDTDIMEVEMLSYCYDRRCVVKSEKFLEDMFLDLNTYAGEYMFYDYESGDGIDFGFPFLGPWEYFDETGLMVGAEITGQMQVNSEFRVLRLENKGYEELYRYTPGIAVSSVEFDNTGEYILFHGRDGGSEVIEAATGKKLFIIDRVIQIYDGVIYDVSSDLIIPNKLPVSALTTINEFKSRASQLG